MFPPAKKNSVEIPVYEVLGENESASVSACDILTSNSRSCCERLKKMTAGLVYLATANHNQDKALR